MSIKIDMILFLIITLLLIWCKKADSINCLNGWKSDENGKYCYKVVKEDENQWVSKADAQTLCTKEHLDSRLPILKDKVETQFFYDLYKNKVCHLYFLGASKIENVWYWDDASKIEKTYLIINESFVEMNTKSLMAGVRGQWFDMGSVNDACGVICQMPEKKDAVWGSWEYSDCSATCGSGKRVKHRNISTPSSGGGSIVGSNKTEEICSSEPCPEIWFESRSITSPSPVEECDAICKNSEKRKHETKQSRNEMEWYHIIVLVVLGVAFLFIVVCLIACCIQKTRKNQTLAKKRTVKDDSDNIYQLI